MDVIKSDVRKLVNKELNAANKRFRPFASPHRGWPGGKENWHGTEKKVAPGGCGNRNHNNEPENGGSGKASV